MHEEYWHQRWAEGRTGWHRDEVDRMLETHWPSLGLASGTRVLVPLCGMSLDMAWLAGLGHGVLGVELSRMACEGFFTAQRTVPAVRRDGPFEVFAAEGIELLCGDVFALRERDFAGVAGIYDRAALIALPPPLRQRYAQAVYARMPAGSRGLLITLEYDQREREGPPFAVHEDEVRGLLAADWEVECVERRDILESQPQFRAEGVSALATAVYRLQRG